MGFKYILGRAGAGKTSRCVKEIAYALAQPGSSPLIYIVPEQFSLQSEKNIIQAVGKEAIMRVQVLSFQRLAFHLFAETGAKSSVYLDDIGKRMLLRKILNDVKADLKFYERPLITKGFVDKIAEAITEFYEYNVAVEELMYNAGADERLKLKLQDLSLIYQQYLIHIGENYISTDEILDLLADKILEGSYLKGAQIWIDSFSGFTPQEYKVILRLAQQTEAVHIALCSDEKQPRLEASQTTDVFAETKNTIHKLNKLASENGIKVQPPLFLDQPFRFQTAPELKFLEENYFSPKALPNKSQNHRVKVYKALDKYDEIEFVADYITALIRDSNYRYSDIAVITSDGDSYANVIESTFTNYNIPCFIDRKLDILTHSLTEFIRALLEIGVTNWSYESVFRFLKTGFTNIALDDVDMLENYVLAYGIKGYKWRQDQWLYGFGGKQANFDKGEIHRVKDKVTACANIFYDGLNLKKTYTVETYCEKLFFLLKERQATDRLSMLHEEALTAKDSFQAWQHSQIWNKLCSVFDKMVEILGQEEMTLSEFAQVVDAGLASCEMGIIPPVQDQVIVGDLVRSRTSEIKALFIVGANEGLFPQPKSETGIFTDEERATLNQNGTEIAPDSIQRTFLDNYLLYTAFTKAGRLLTITCPLIGTDGKGLFPAPIINRVGKLFPDAEIKDPGVVALSAPKPVLGRLSSNMAKIMEGGGTLEEQMAYRWFSQSPAYEAAIDRYKALLAPKDRESLSPQTLAQIYAHGEVRASASRIERYVRCPFSFFIEYTLEAKERQQYQVSRLELGNIFHFILERFSEIVFREGKQWQDLTEEDMEKYTKMAFEGLKDEMADDLFESDGSAKYVLERAKQAAKKSIWALCQHIRRGKFAPYGAEVDFGIKSPITGMVIEIDKDHRMVLRGRIDRIDLLDANGASYVKIIDYKSGRQKFDITDIYYGMQVQLLLYMDSILKGGEKLIKTKYKLMPGGILYFSVDNPVITADRQISPEEINNLLLEQFKMSGLVLKDPTVVQAMDNRFEKSSPVIPVSYTAKGEVSKSGSSVATEEEFAGILSYTVDTVRGIGKKMICGDIHPAPFKYGQKTGCDFCGYRSICSFDQTLSKEYQYNVMRKKKGLEALIPRENSEDSGQQENI